jgi:hypothetical protein
MGHASFHIHRDPGHGTWVVEEEDNREIGGIFAPRAVTGSPRGPCVTEEMADRARRSRPPASGLTPSTRA